MTAPDQSTEAPSAAAERIGETTQHVVEVLGATRHSADCVRSALLANYDRGGVGLTMPPCTCGHDDAVARAVVHMQTQEAIISDFRAESHWLAAERDDARAALQEAEDREAALHKSIWRIVSFMEDAPELWGNPAADRVLNCLRALLAAPARSDLEAI